MNQNSQRKTRLFSLGDVPSWKNETERTEKPATPPCEVCLGAGYVIDPEQVSVQYPAGKLIRCPKCYRPATDTKLQDRLEHLCPLTAIERTYSFDRILPEPGITTALREGPGGQQERARHDPPLRRPRPGQNQPPDCGRQRGAAKRTRSPSTPKSGA